MSTINQGSLWESRGGSGSPTFSGSNLHRQGEKEGYVASHKFFSTKFSGFSRVSAPNVEIANVERILTEVFRKYYLFFFIQKGNLKAGAKGEDKNELKVLRGKFFLI